MNCLFVETPTEKILVETGIGEKWTDKQTAIYGIFRKQSLLKLFLKKPDLHLKTLQSSSTRIFISTTPAGIRFWKRRRGKEEKRRI